MATVRPRHGSPTAATHSSGWSSDDNAGYTNLASSLLEEPLERMNAFEMTFEGLSTSDCLAIQRSDALDTLKEFERGAKWP
jgi:hypothetical protein